LRPYGPIDGESFKAYIEQFLVPTLSPATLFIMDNLGSHKGHAVRRPFALSARGFSSCRPAVLTSILSSRCSPS
jgi:transposase